jgi:hypothetical protein
VSYNRKLGPWSVSANYNYDQNVQTLLAIYTMSTMNYGASVSRQLPKHINWSVGFGGGRSGFSQQAGDGSHEETVHSSVGWRGYTVSGNYSQSAGTSVLTASGLVTQPAPIATANELILFNGSSYGFGIGATPVRNMSIGVSYSNATSTTLGSNLNNNNATKLMNGVYTYRFRKLLFTAGATRFQQSVGGAVAGGGTQPGTITSYYFGISRWFKFF